MICLPDNDIILKLAACDLLFETLALLKVEQGDVYVLPTARHKIRKDKKFPAKYGKGVDRALAFLESVKKINFAPDPDELVLLDGVRDPDTGGRLIHAGEQVLFACTHSLDDYLLATGDKVCLRALTNAPTCVHIHAHQLAYIFMRANLRTYSCAPLWSCYLCGTDNSLAHRGRGF